MSLPIEESNALKASVLVPPSNDDSFTGSSWTTKPSQSRNDVSSVTSITSSSTQPPVMENFSDSSVSHFGANRSSQSGRAPTSADELRTFSKRNSGVMGEFRSSIVCRRTSSVSLDSASAQQMNSLSVNKLRFRDVGLYGRDQEKHALQEVCFPVKEQATEETSHKQNHVVLISGESGVGKTLFVTKVLRDQTNKRGGLYLMGKFHMKSWNRPYSGIGAACRGLCAQLLNADSSEGKKPRISLSELERALVSSLGPELGLLLTVLPELAEIVGENDATEQAPRQKTPLVEVSQSHEDATHRFHNAFVRLFSVLSSFFDPVVLCLDDLQWADRYSLELVKVLLSNPDDFSLVVVACYRHNEASLSMNDAIQWCRTQAQMDPATSECATGPMNVTEIHLDNLSLSAVGEILTDLLSMDTHETEDLTILCQKRTNGNAFYVLAFVSMLQEEGLLTFNFGSMKWVWSVLEIERHTTATMNVVDIAEAKVKRQPEEMTQILVIASCLGSSFDKRSIRKAWNRSEEDDRKLYELLDLAEEEGFFETSPNGSCYQWTHDKIQCAASELVSSDDMCEMQFNIGINLIEQYSESDLEASIFMVADLVNQERYTKLDSKRSIQIAEINLRAAKKAVQVSAFSSASKYIRKGVALLPDDMWSTQYDLTLDLHSTGAEIEGGFRFTRQMETYCNSVIDEDLVPLLDKMRAYNALLNGVANQNGMVRAVDLCLAILKKLDCKFPRNTVVMTVSTIVGLTRTQGRVKSLTPSDIKSLPLLTDRKMQETMKILNKLTLYCYLSKNPLLPLVGLRTIEWTLEYGVCEASPEAFLNTGVIVTGILLDFECGAIFSRCADIMFEKLKCRAIEARVAFVKVYLAPWTTPYRSILKPCFEAYKTGMLSGDTESASWSLVHHSFFGYLSGLSLSSIAMDCGVYSRQITELKRDKQALYLRIFWQLVQNLRGLSEDLFLLKGDAFDVDSIAEMTARPENQDVLCHFQVQQTHLYAYLANHEAGAKLALEKGDSYGKTLPAGALIISDMFLRAVSLFAMARQSGLRKFRKEAHRLKRTIDSFVSKGNLNARHYQAILDAEMAALSGKQLLSQQRYEEAIVVCAKSGFIQDAALAEERYGEYLLSVLQDEEAGLYRLKEAVRFYTEWGAHAKVELLQAKYTELLPVPREIVL